mmetsp:Transcript_39273/g.37702  ORF Transcript_39273/g.37702 Transcript_39273/m.37702 type:complete len:125 (+) Transcript_39273:993-1367(+)
MSSNKTIVKINIDSNTMKHKYLEEIQQACARNKLIQKKHTLPKFKEELGILKEISEGNGGLEHRDHCVKQASNLMKERVFHEKQIYNGEDELDDMRGVQNQILDEFKLVKHQNEEELEELDRQI